MSSWVPNQLYTVTVMVPTKSFGNSCALLVTIWDIWFSICNCLRASWISSIWRIVKIILVFDGQHKQNWARIVVLLSSDCCMALSTVEGFLSDSTWSSVPFIARTTWDDRSFCQFIPNCLLVVKVCSFHRDNIKTSAKISYHVIFVSESLLYWNRH